MGWSAQGYFNGRPQTDYGNGKERPEVDLRNANVPEGLEELNIYYGCSGSEFFRGEFAGSAGQAKAALQKVRWLTVYKSKYGGICRLEDHFAHFVFHEHSDGHTYFFDTSEQPHEWHKDVMDLLPPEMHHLVPGGADPLPPG